MHSSAPNDPIVLVGVLKSKRDLQLLFKERWYRIPIAHLPRRKFEYIAFYQPATFGNAGKQIRYYAKVMGFEVKKRRELLPEEKKHPRVEDDYQKIKVGIIRKLPRPIRNFLPRRISFGFTSLSKLLTSRNILQVYAVADTEQMVKRALTQARLKFNPQCYVLFGEKGSRKRYCLDFAIFCKDGKIAIECDNLKAHSSKLQQRHDRAKDRFLRAHGWRVLRLKEKEIVSNIANCLTKINKTIQRLGGAN